MTNKNKKLKTNYWKIATIILIILAVGIIINHEVEKNKIVDFGDFTISQPDYKAIVKFAEENNWNGFVVINPETKETKIFKSIK